MCVLGHCIIPPPPRSTFFPPLSLSMGNLANMGTRAFLHTRARVACGKLRGGRILSGCGRSIQQMKNVSLSLSRYFKESERERDHCNTIESSPLALTIFKIMPERGCGPAI